MFNSLSILATAYATDRWRIWEWFNGKLDRVLSKRPVHRPSSLQEIWKKAFGREFLDGDYIELTRTAKIDRWCASEWVPKSPGQTWIEDSWFSLSPNEIAGIFQTSNPRETDLSDEARDFIFRRNYMPYSHWEMRYGLRVHNHLSQGFSFRLGAYRPSLNPSSENRYALLSIFSGREYMIDLGFPVIVSRPVYRKFLEHSESENAVELEGVIRVREIDYSDMFKRYLQTISAPRNDQLEQLVSQSIGLPRIVGELISPLDVSFTTTSQHPLMTIRVDGYNVISIPAST